MPDSANNWGQSKLKFENNFTLTPVIQPQLFNFLLLNTNLPRSVGCCIADIANCINSLPNSDSLLAELVKLEAYVQAIDTRGTTQAQLRAILDDLQNKLGELHNRIADNWFLRAAE